MGRVLAVIIWIITLLSVLLFVSGKWWFPAPISEHAPALDRQFMITLVIVGLSFAAAQIAWVDGLDIATPATTKTALSILTAAIV